MTEKRKWRNLVAALAGFVAVAWLMPQTLYGDCVKRVTPPGEENCVTEKEYEHIFPINENNYRITLKFLKNY